MNEDKLIGRIEKRLWKKPGRTRTRHLRLGMGDDGALLAASPGCELILTCDWLLEGMHFLRRVHPADVVGWKCLARAASDIAAMGGAPRCFLLSLALPPSRTGRWLDDFLSGLRRAARRLGVELAGGDTTGHRKILINATVVGEVERGRAVLRSGARPGDLVYVSGCLGEAQLGLQLLLDGQKPGRGMDALLRKHLYPEPRIELGRWLAEKRLATAMTDTSDGLSTDLGHLCKASRTGARVYSSRLPLAQVPGRRRSPRPNRGRRRFDPMRLALDGGEDYELLFTVPRRLAHRVPKRFRGLPLTMIGEMTREKGTWLVEGKNRLRPLAAGGWNPFQGWGRRRKGPATAATVEARRAQRV